MISVGGKAIPTAIAAVCRHPLTEGNTNPTRTEWRIQRRLAAEVNIDISRTEWRIITSIRGPSLARTPALQGAVKTKNLNLIRKKTNFCLSELRIPLSVNRLFCYSVCLSPQDFST
jgi:hypothetical protein